MMITNKGENTVKNKLRNSITDGIDLFIEAEGFSLYGLYSFCELRRLNSINIIMSSFDKITGLDNEITLKNKLLQRMLANDLKKLLQNNLKINKLTELPMANLILKNNDDLLSICSSINSFSAELMGDVPTSSHQTMVILGNDIFDSFQEKQKRSCSAKEELVVIINLLIENKIAHKIYLQTIYNIFQGTLLSNFDDVVKSATGFKNTVVWNKLYEFQKDGVLGAIEKIQKYNGCIIADSVGLGKTFEALAIIKYYELRNERVLVLCPKKLRANWQVYNSNDTRNILAKDKFNYDILNHTDLTRIKGLSGDINLTTVNWGNYDLIVIDESHNFRNNNPSKGESKSRYEKLKEDIIKSGVNTKVLMLSATPVNNKLSDLRNQIEIITADDDSALKHENIDSIKSVTKTAQAKFTSWLKNGNKGHLIDVLPYGYFKLLDLLTIARSRKHIERYYQNTSMGTFPKRLPPKNIKANITTNNNFPSLSEVVEKINSLELAIYSTMQFIRIDKKREYENKYDTETKKGTIFSQQTRESNLINLMRVNLLKRLESSIDSFKKTIINIINAINETLEKVTNKQELSQVSISDIDEDDEAYKDEIIGKKIKVLLKDIDTLKFSNALNSDKDILSNLLKLVQNIGNDNKLTGLKKVIKDKLENPINDNNKKIIVFTAFTDTAQYLYNELNKLLKNEYNLYTALITGSKNDTNTKNVRNNLDDILLNFSPLSKERNKFNNENNNNIDILIATDCISEGQNLQDCDCLINYDIHWNPMRIIQRFGRIDRIGSQNESIQLINFWADVDLDEYINLENKVKGRLALLNISSTGDEDIIDEKQKIELEYRKQQLEKLQSVVIDLEDMDNSMSITDLTFNNFKTEINKNIDIIDNKYNGFYATIISKEHQSGVIFCLKSLNDKNKKYAMHPYYMVYIKENGEILYNYKQLKYSLDVLQQLAYKEVDTKAEDLLKTKTNHYKNMEKYSVLLTKAINSILEKKEEELIDGLFTMGGTNINDSMNNEFEVISYLIVQN